MTPITLTPRRFVLAISTSSGVAKVAAAAEPGAPLFSYEITDYKSQSAQLLPMLQQHLLNNGLLPENCAAIAVDIGPGGFTSLRTACGIAQGLAVAWNVPTVPMTSFECMVPTTTPNEQLSEQLSEHLCQTFTVLIDARLNEIYAAEIQHTLEGTHWVQHPHLLPMENLKTLKGPALCDAPLFAQLPISNPGVQQGAVSAIRLAQLAWQRVTAGLVAAPFECQPLYVRDKVAQTTSERLATRHGVV